MGYDYLLGGAFLRGIDRALGDAGLVDFVFVTVADDEEGGDASYGDD